MIEYIKKIIQHHNVQKAILVVLLLITLFIWNKSCGTLYDELGIANNNILAMRDTVKVTKTKNGQLEYEKRMLITDKEMLKAYSDTLFAELEKEKRNVKILWRTRVVINDDSIEDGITSVYRKNDSTYKLGWLFERNSQSTYRKIQGHTSFVLNRDSSTIKDVTSTIDNFMFVMELVGGVEEYEDTYKIFVRSKDPSSNIVFTNIEGAILDKALFKRSEQDNFIIGPYVGVSTDDFSKYHVQYGIGITFRLAGFKVNIF